MNSEGTLSRPFPAFIEADARRSSWLRSWWTGAAVVFLVTAVLWAPRLSGPIDMRYDASVYYELGTSLAAGEGYRIGSEPGAPTGIQYPPGLPLLVAVHQWILGTADLAVVAPSLRWTYAILFLGLGLAVLTLGRAFGGPLIGLAAAGFCLVQVNTYLLSDMLFTELPFTLVSVLFALLFTSRRLENRPYWRESAGFVLALTGFMLRTAGLALLLAWVVEALTRLRWKLAGLRMLLGAVPFLLWQAHVLRVQSSAEYQQPAYEYQRAPYQFYNVSYGENLSLIDPFRPELGSLNAKATLARVAANLRVLPLSLGEVVSEPVGFWSAGLRELLDQKRPPGPPHNPLLYVAVFAWTGLTMVGFCVLPRPQGWFVTAFTVASIALVMSTPWPGQFMRYLTPLSPFLSLAALVGVVWLAKRWWHGGRTRWGVFGAAFVAGFVLITLVVQAYTVWNTFRLRLHSAPVVAHGGSGVLAPKWFYYDAAWADWSKAVEWIDQNTPADAIIATVSPHLCYLRTGRKSVMPPMESDSHRACDLIEQVPVSYVIIDDLAFMDIGRRYALPAIKTDPARWKRVYEHNETSIYENVSRSQVALLPEPILPGGSRGNRGSISGVR